MFSHRSVVPLPAAVALSLLLGTSSPAVAADGPLFAPPRALSTGNSPYYVAIGDLNGDGKPDLAAANAFGGTISVLLGNGDGSFGAKTDWAAGIAPHSVAIGDFNGDGRPDLASANAFYGLPGTVSVMLGSGNGTFGMRTDYITGFVPVYAAIGDLNGDGKLDLAVANYDGHSVSVLLGKGNGSFGANTDYGTGDYCPFLAIGDLNGDGKPDLAVVNYLLNSVSVLLGHGDGSFGAKTEFGAGLAPMSVAIGDLNGDGKQDLVTANQYIERTVSVLLGHGDGTFGARTDFGVGSYPNHVAIGDLNGDGKPDLAVANLGDSGNDPNDVGSVSVLLGHGDGRFAAKTDYEAGIYCTSVAIADLDGDGKADLAVTNSWSNTVSVLLNTGASGCVPTPMTLELSPNTLNLRSMGHWVTATLEPEPPASPADIDVGSILLNGSVPVDTSIATSIGDADSDGRPDLTVKFDRVAVETIVEEGEAVTVTVAGEMGSGCFEATDVIRVIRAHVTAPSAGSVLEGGSTTEVRWDTPAEVAVQSVAILWSSDDGVSWTLVARDLPNSGAYRWNVPSASTDQARVAVVLVESAGESGFDVTGVLGVSGRFTITSTLGIPATGIQLALKGQVPNPGRNLTVSFTLPDARPARLVVYDVGGREVSRREVGGLGAGVHMVTLNPSRTLAPGLYLVHLVHGSRRLVARAAIVQ